MQLQKLIKINIKNLFTRKNVSKGISSLLGLLVILAFLVFSLSVFDTPFRIKLYTVMSGSMNPVVSVGSVAIVHPDTNYGIGDVVTFNSEEGTNTPRNTTTHRIIDEQVSDGKTVYITKGDSNDSADATPVAKDRILGKVILALPYLGYLLAFARTTRGLVFLIVIPATIIAHNEYLNLKKNILEEIKKRKERKAYYWQKLMIPLPVENQATVPDSLPEHESILDNSTQVENMSNLEPNPVGKTILGVHLNVSYLLFVISFLVGFALVQLVRGKTYGYMTATVRINSSMTASSDIQLASVNTPTPTPTSEVLPTPTCNPQSPSVALTLSSDKKKASFKAINLIEYVKLSYEFTYQSGNEKQGTAGTINLSGECEIEREFDLGTCSSGVCTYHPNPINLKLKLILEDASGEEVTLEENL